MARKTKGLYRIVDAKLPKITTQFPNHSQNIPLLNNSALTASALVTVLGQPFHSLNVCIASPAFLSTVLAAILETDRLTE